MFKKKDTKTGSQGSKTRTKKPGKAAAKGGKTQAGKTTVQSGKTQDRSDVILAKLMAIEKETRLEQARDRVDQLEDENIALNIEQLLKIIGSGE